MPQVIQSGPDIAVSQWRLARAVSAAGQLGVVSGTALAVVLARRLGLGDPDSLLRSAFEHFPYPGVARRVWSQFFIPGGKAAGQPFELTKGPALDQGPALVELTVLANYVEVHLAKAGHDGAVGIQYGGRTPIPLLPSLFGALLAGVDYVLVNGAHRRVLGDAVDSLTRGFPAQAPVAIQGSNTHPERTCRFDPSAFDPGPLALRRPKLVAVMASVDEATGAAGELRGLDGVAVLGRPLTADREGLSGLRAAVGRVPFWLGAAPDREQLARARTAGAAGIAVSGAFCFCEESGIDPDLRKQVVVNSLEEHNRLETAPTLFPGGLPTSLVRLGGTLAEPEVFAGRSRICDVGSVREACLMEDGAVGYRCPGEPVERFAAKGGQAGEASGHPCYCNAMLASVGLGQVRSGGETEKALLAGGEDLDYIRRFVKPGATSYRAADVLEFILGSGAHSLPTG